MRPLSLKLRNFIGIRSGLNRDELSLDFAGLRGLIAIVGENGMGKTTVLDNLHPYRLMPFRAGGYSPRQFSYYEETFGDALKDFQWEHGGRVYRSEIVIKGTNKTKKTEAYLYVRTPDGWAPVTAPSGTVSDGKTDTYDECVNAILGTPDMFFTAVFSAQNRKQLADYEPASIKTLLSDLLGLEPLLTQSDAAVEAAKYQQARYEGFSTQLQMLTTAEAELRAASSDVERLSADLDAAKSSRAGARKRCGDAAMALAEARAAAANQDDNARRRQAVLTEREAAESEYRANRDRLTADAEREKETERCAALTAELEVLNGQLKRLESQIAGYRAAIAAAPMEDTTGELAVREGELKGFDELIAADDRAIEELAGALGEVGRLRAQMDALKREGQSLVAQSEGHKARAALVDAVPCAGTAMIASCALLKDAHGAKALADKTGKEADAKRTEYAALRVQLEAATAKADEHRATAELRAKHIADRRKVEAEISDLRRDQAALAAAAQARAALSDAEAIISTTRQQADDKKKAIESQRAGANQRLAALRAEFTRIQTVHTERLARLDQQLGAIPPATEAVQNLARAEREQEEADAALAQLDARISTLTQELATATAKKQTAGERMRGAEQVRAEANRLAEDVAQWRLLAKGLGRDGIVALSIDDAGPAISGIANELLTACYGPRFSLRFDTQAATKSGTVKETFDIRVFDAERGDDKSITKTSGGERVWLNDCLCRAIALFRAQQSGQTYQCLFSDEADGALSEERKQHFVRVKRKVLDIGGYAAEFLITHSADVVAEVDHIIRLADFREAA